MWKMQFQNKTPGPESILQDAAQNPSQKDVSSNGKGQGHSRRERGSCHNRKPGETVDHAVAQLYLEH